MNMIDSTREMFSGKNRKDISLSFRRVRSIEWDDDFTTTEFTMCAHNETHIIAPSHVRC